MQQTARHYAELSRAPGWRDYCRAKVRELEESDDAWKGLLEMVRHELGQK